MNKIKLLYTIIFILLIFNTIILYAYLKSSSKSTKGDVAKKHIIEKLKFDDEQVHEYEKLIPIHVNSMNEVDFNIRSLRKELYHTLATGEISKRDSLINEINLNQKSIELINYHHFSDIRKICKPVQIPYYNELTIELPKLFEGHQDKIRHRSKK